MTTYCILTVYMAARTCRLPVGVGVFSVSPLLSWPQPKPYSSKLLLGNKMDDATKDSMKMHMYSLHNARESIILFNRVECRAQLSCVMHIESRCFFQLCIIALWGWLTWRLDSGLGFGIPLRLRCCRPVSFASLSHDSLANLSNAVVELLVWTTC